MTDHVAVASLEPVLTGIIEIKDPEGNVKFKGPVFFTPIKEPANGSDTNHSG